MKRTITVLKEDIDNGTPQSATNCAVARAANRDLADLLKGGAFVSVSRSYLSIKEPPYDNWLCGNLPSIPRCLIKQFDYNLPIEPFKFEIELLPVDMIKLH